MKNFKNARSNVFQKFSKKRNCSSYTDDQGRGAGGLFCGAGFRNEIGAGAEIILARLRLQCALYILNKMITNIQCLY